MAKNFRLAFQYLRIDSSSTPVVSWYLPNRLICRSVTCCSTEPSLNRRSRRARRKRASRRLAIGRRWWIVQRRSSVAHAGGFHVSSTFPRPPRRENNDGRHRQLDTTFMVQPRNRPPAAGFFPTAASTGRNWSTLPSLHDTMPQFHVPDRPLLRHASPKKYQSSNYSVDCKALE